MIARGEGRKDLKYTPMRCKPALRSWCCRTMLVKKTSHRGATLLASLANKLADSAALRYLRLRASLEAHRGKILSSPPKRKIRHARMSMPYFWRRRKDLNLRAGYPTYTLSRGASSPLEYFSMVKPY